MSTDVKFAHGKKANVEAALAAGKIDRDDFVVFSDTDDELGFVGHDGKVHPIKSRTNEDYTLEGVRLGNLRSGDVIPAGSSIDDLIKLIGISEDSIESKVFESFVRIESFPLDSTELYDNLDEALEYLKTEQAYAGQIIKVLNNDDGQYIAYIVQEDNNNTKTLERLATYKELTEAISKIIDLAPEDFDTLREIAEWIGSHEGGFENLIKDVKEIQHCISTLPNDENGNKVTVKNYVDNSIGDITNSNGEKISVKQYIENQLCVIEF